MSRWVRIQADVFEHPVFAAEPFSEREAWLWLIAKAAWRETRHRVGSSVVTVPEGSLFVTLREMQTAWRWRSDTRVRTFLRMLENERMILVDSNAGKTQVTICNYSEYQNPERTENAEITHEKRTENALKTPIHQYTTSSLRSEDRRSPRDELETVLDPERAAAVVEHRKRIRKPLTAHAAKLLARKFAQVSDPNAAADAMVANGWQGFEPEWLDNRRSVQATAPPNDRGLMNATLDQIISGNGNDSDNSGNWGSIEGSFQRLALPARD